ncbi:MAG: hypothetical protein IPK26_21100 [Planctomycetes bacterium]|nr:hypothetical protein [Planctomycetota bacterium]
MSEPSDWDPLPPETVGPVVAPSTPEIAPARPRPMAAPIAAKAPPPTPASAKPEPLADLALTALRQRLAQSKPRDPIVAALNHSLRLGERRQRAVKAAFAATAAPVRSELQDPARLPTGTKPVDRDFREKEPWFRELPAAEQERLRSKWTYDRTRFSGYLRHCGKQRLAIVGSAVLVFTIIGVLQTPILGNAAILRMMVLGVVAGIGWGCAPMARTWLALFGVVVYLFGMLSLVMPPSTFTLVAYFCGAWLVTNLGAVIAMEHEAKLRGGFLAMRGPPPPKPPAVNERPPAPAVAPLATAARPASAHGPAG